MHLAQYREDDVDDNDDGPPMPCIMMLHNAPVLEHAVVCTLEQIIRTFLAE
jgi:hypothetical protein